ncbi:MAG: GIY-YIG nuclease family protein [Alphaproteobacteria bacterium]|nr:GIY-YIG nuclease family protein [Alphaproteobacteria bacterium]
MARQPCNYILASQKHGALYIGVTSNLAQRLWHHKEGIIEGSSKRYQIYLLVYFEMFDDMATAIAREKQLKNWHRDWKCNLIEAHNPAWADLAPGLGL